MNDNDSGSDGLKAMALGLIGTLFLAIFDLAPIGLLITFGLVAYYIVKKD